MSEITAMEFTLRMDRPLKDNVEEESPYYLSPGGYEVAGKQFDFSTSAGDVKGEALDRIEYEVYDLDETYCENGIPTYEDVVSGEWSEFFIFTGEGEDPEIRVKEVEALTVHFDNGTAYSVTGDGLNRINHLIDDYNRFFEDDKEQPEKE